MTGIIRNDQNGHPGRKGANKNIITEESCLSFHPHSGILDDEELLDPCLPIMYCEGLILMG